MLVQSCTARDTQMVNPCTAAKIILHEIQYKCLPKHGYSAKEVSPKTRVGNIVL